MSSQLFRVTAYRFRATFARRWGGLLGVVLVIGLIGGLSMASIAAGRRTQSSYPTFMSSTNPSDLTFSAGSPNGGSLIDHGLESKIAAVPDVKHVVTLLGPDVYPLSSSGVPRLSAIENVSVVGSLNGMFASQDRMTVIEGRLANPRRVDEVVLDAHAARRLGVRVGDVIPLGFFSARQTEESGFGGPSVKPRFRVDAKVVGVVEINDEVVQDDIDRAYGFLILTPAFLHKAIAVSPGAAVPGVYGIQLRHPDVATVEQDLINLLPGGATYEFHVTAALVAEVELSIKPESVALGAFGALAALIALVLAAQAISRQLRRDQEDRRILRALGASPFEVAGEGLLGAFGAILLGAVLAFIVAVGLSPLAPLGPVRRVYPDSGVSFDGTVLVPGLLVLVIVLSAVALSISYRSAPQRNVRARRARRSSIARGTQLAGLPVTATLGAHFALEPGRGRTEVPVRSVLAGSVLAVALVVATTTFADGLSTLISHPALYGWNWNYLLNPSNAVPPKAVTLLNHDPDVAAWSGSTLANAQIDGRTVPMLFGGVRPKVSPPILSGHGLDATNQVVLGALTMAELHKKVGDTVIAQYGTPADAPVYVPPTKLVIVGTATFPAVGYTSFIQDHTSMGIGAMIPAGILPAAFQRAILNPDPNLDGPEMIFVRLKPGISPSAGRANLQKIADYADRLFAHDPRAKGNVVDVLGVQRPAQIVNYRSIGSTPVILSLGLALGAIFALGLTLAASVRRRRRDLALFKAFGFTRGQLASTVAWQATVTALAGIILGIPVGVLVGRELWTLFAKNINAVPFASVPVTTIALTGVGALVFAILVSAIPGRSAARTSTAIVLRSE